MSSNDDIDPNRSSRRELTKNTELSTATWFAHALRPTATLMRQNKLGKFSGTEVLKAQN